jgi:LysM repeat protein
MLGWPVAQVGEKEPGAAIGSLPVVTMTLSPPSTSATSSTTPPSLTPPNFDSVRVMPGQTLYAISLANLGGYNGKVLQELRKLNPRLNDPDYLQAGQELKIPTNNTTESERLARGQSAQTAAQNSEAP